MSRSELNRVLALIIIAFAVLGLPLLVFAIIFLGYNLLGDILLFVWNPYPIRLLFILIKGVTLVGLSFFLIRLSRWLMD
ncbi:MAG: hypothetical protein ACLFVP_10015 [Candidatus Bathyarchaeia archaeon]